ncbi:hypothetical protein VNI00_008995 [Paramarasmius palmivorus]|uniref:Fungal-type protein kinase domain-containing protein n=1 Tax=Paramarasmius palmivorus TaxID=297713 RepID=A0AAW0CRC7_9AGAR
MSKPQPSSFTTPAKRTGIRSVVPYTSLHVFRDKRMERVGCEMARKYVGPMEPKKFLDDFLPRGQRRTKLFTAHVQQQLYNVGYGTGVRAEKDMYEPLMTVLADFCPDIRLVDTSDDADDTTWAHQPGLIKPDISAYTKESGVDRNDISRTEFWMELKWYDTADGFDDTENMSFEKVAMQARDTRAQLSTYAGAQLVSQFRTHAFSVQLTRGYARLIRWDREGAIVTKKFCYYNEPHLVDFLWRYNHASSEARGYDPTVVEITNPARAQEVRDALEMDATDRVWEFTIIDEQGEKHVFTGGKLEFRGVASPAGRSTRGFLVLDHQGERRYLKDTWRILNSAIQKEGDVYAVLKQHNVSHVPDVVASGDAVGSWQVTKTSKYRTISPQAAQLELRLHQHYFIVFAQVGTTIKNFKDSHELVQATAHAIQAHREAYERAKVLHRDVSAGNILITQEGEGLLIDWEFSKPLDSTAPRILERTGTWQFMSAMLLADEPGEVDHMLADDLESFYHVLCWVTLLHGQHGLEDDQVKRQLARVYDSWHGVGAVPATGGEVKKVTLNERWMDKKAKLAPGPFRKLVVELEQTLGVRYIGNGPFVNQDMVREFLKKLDSHDAFVDIFSQALQHKDQLKSQTRDTRRDIKLFILDLRSATTSDRKRKKSDSELEAEEEMAKDGGRPPQRLRIESES